VSDRIGDAALLRIDEVHHTIALFPTDRPGIQHINHQVATGDDVMRSFYFLSERGVPGRFSSR
jgi:2,3-dihydroxy-p-cumate/2,3-dihydroxybenzoate 3,4-dioxygenase